jgi:uncharacterized RDD family membrane protein YckC
MRHDQGHSFNKLLNMQYRIASLSKRMLAAVIDILLIIPIITAGVYVTNYVLKLPVTPELSLLGFEVRMDSWAEEHFWELVAFYSAIKLLITFFYFTFFEASEWQGTPGKRLLNIKVTDMNSERISLKKGAARFFGRILSAQLLIGYIMIFFNRHKQGLHDFIASTLVQEH